MSDFAGRERELEALRLRLEEVGRHRRGGFIALRGRRRVGKSRLVEEFAQRSGAPYLFYTAVQEPSERELDRFARALERSDLPAAELVRGGAPLGSWEAALGLAATGASWERPILIVIDEFPYLAEKDPAVEAIVQTIWDRAFQKQPVLLILIGSDVATMEAMSEQGRPLYDRPRQMVVHPLSPAEVAEMLDLPAADALDAYLAIGGFPVLALEWGAGRSLSEYLAEALTDPSSFLVISAERALAAEFPAEAQARAVLGAIGADARSHKDIGARTGLNATALDRAFRLLLAKRVVERLTPYSAKASPKNARWIVSDPYLRFWLRFVSPDLDLIERGRGGVLVERFKQSWTAYRGRAVEPLVRDSLERLLPDPRFGEARYIGGYWTRTHSVEVDLVGGDTQPAAAKIEFIGSIKWRATARFNRTDAGELGRHRASVPGAGAGTKLIGVSRQGFDDGGALDARFGPEDLVEAWRE